MSNLGNRRKQRKQIWSDGRTNILIHGLFIDFAQSPYSPDFPNLSRFTKYPTFNVKT